MPTPIAARTKGCFRRRQRRWHGALLPLYAIVDLSHLIEARD